MWAPGMPLPSRSPVPRLRPAVVSVALSCLSLVVHGQPLNLTLTGACAAKAYLNGVPFLLQGRTFNGAPYYKMLNQQEYIYYDPSCDGSMTAGTAGWIIGPVAPSLTAVSDLDGNQACNYDARINSTSPTGPPATGSWLMNCGSGTSTQFLVLLGTPSNATTLWIGAMPPTMLALNGACAANGGLNGLTYQLMGATASGAPYFKAYGLEEYLYYDPDCDGAAGPVVPPRWILSGSTPSITAMSDLDQDGRCDYHARVDSMQIQMPPALTTWTMYCGATGWLNVVLSLANVSQVQTVTTTTSVGVAVSAAAGHGNAAGATMLVFLCLQSLLQ